MIIFNEEDFGYELIVAKANLFYQTFTILIKALHILIWSRPFLKVIKPNHRYGVFHIRSRWLFSHLCQYPDVLLPDGFQFLPG